MEKNKYFLEIKSQQLKLVRLFFLFAIILGSFLFFGAGKTNAAEPVPDTTPPTVTNFAIPATAASLTVSISFFTATDDMGVTGYKLTETADTPLPGDSGWTGTEPASYTFASAGAKTLYAWAKDAAGNVSGSLNDSVTITLPVSNVAQEEEDYDNLEISKVKYSVINNNQIKITFKTNNDSKGTAKFGANRSLKQKKKESQNKKSHSIKLKNLAPGVKYFFRLSAKDEYDQSERTKIYSITLPKATASTPVVKNTAARSNGAAPSSQDQENQNKPVPQVSLPLEQNNNDTSNQTKENTDPVKSPSGDNGASRNAEPQLQKNVFKWWNPFTWF